MKRRRSTILAGFLMLGLLVIVLFGLHEVGPMAQSSADQSIRTPLVAYLAELGQQYDCFFTLETAWKDDRPTEIIENHLLERSSATGLQQELERLVKIVPNFTYEIDKAQPRIIHVMDKRLAQQKAYALEAFIKSIDFSGKVNDLPAEIHKQGIPISDPNVISYGSGEASRDFDTSVRVVGKGVKVRDALTDFIPLEGRRGRILWVARTKIGEDPMSYIRYP